MPETDKRNEGEERPQESADMPVPASGGKEPDALAAQSDSSDNSDSFEKEASERPPEHEGHDITEFADNVVSGLEAALATNENEAGDHEQAELDLQQMTEAYFAGWGGGPEGAELADGLGKANAAPIDLQTVSLASLGSSKDWELPSRTAEPEEEPAGPDEFAPAELISLGPEGDGQLGSAEHFESAPHPQANPIDLSELSGIGLASWGASEGMDEEEPAPKFEPVSADLASLEGEELAPEAPAGLPASMGDMSKHNELADAVQSALVSIYGQQTANPSESHAQSWPVTAGNDPSSLVWNKGPAPESGNVSAKEVILNYFDYKPETQEPAAAGPLFASPAADGLTPQEVILSYFDYEGAPGVPGPEPEDYGLARERREEEPLTLPQAEPAVPFRRLHPEPESPAQRPRWEETPARAPQYSAPQSLPVLAAGPGTEQKHAAAPAGQESSRLLGAAAIGLMGGIAIAASLAAFLIYGPHPSTVEIPGIGNLRIDKDEQGYGPAAAEEAAKEPGRSQAARAFEYAGEISTADAAAVPGQPSPLSIGVRSQLPSEKLLVSITGVPEGGRLSAGVDAGGGNWLVPPRRLAGLAINLPAGSPSVVSLEAQLLDSNTRAPISAKGAFAVRLASAAADAGQPAPTLAPKQPSQPNPGAGFNTQTTAGSQPPAEAAAVAPQPAPDASFRTQTVNAVPPQKAAMPPFATAPLQQAAPPAQVNAARRTSPRPEVEDLIREGNKHMRDGDILEARQFYQKAVAFGDPEAALAMGRSYDPIYFARIEKKNAEPDAAKAFDWYKRAMDAGATQTAMVRIENLKHFLNE